MELIKKLLSMTKDLINLDVEQAKETAKQIGEQELSEEEKLALKEQLRNLLDYVNYEDAKEILTNLKINNTEALLAELELKNLPPGAPTAEEIKATTAYSMFKDSGTEYATPQDKYYLTYTLAVTAIKSRDVDLIAEVLGGIDA